MMSEMAIFFTSGLMFSDQKTSEISGFFQAKKKPGTEAILERSFRGGLPADFSFDRNESNERT